MSWETETRDAIQAWWLRGGTTVSGGSYPGWHGPAGGSKLQNASALYDVRFDPDSPAMTPPAKTRLGLTSGADFSPAEVRNAVGYTRMERWAETNTPISDGVSSAIFGSLGYRMRRFASATWSINVPITKGPTTDALLAGLGISPPPGEYSEWLLHRFAGALETLFSAWSWRRPDGSLCLQQRPDRPAGAIRRIQGAEGKEWRSVLVVAPFEIENIQAVVGQEAA